MQKFSFGDGTVVEEFQVQRSIRDVLLSKISNRSSREDLEDPFYMVDLGRVLHLFQQWHDMLPSVEPYYAVKCNDDHCLLWTLAALGVGFDCASKNEIRTVLKLGVDPSRIIYANPCKQNTHIRYAADAGVHLMTFDNEYELHKIKRWDPVARLVLRIIADDPTAICNLGAKFGAEMDVAPHLLSVAKNLGLNVVGISFHVGSGAQSPTAYAKALSLAKEAFNVAEQLGFTMTLLDIGGGFPGTADSLDLFTEVTGTVRSSLDRLFDRHSGLKVIAEPGRYFACSTHVLAVNVTGKRCQPTEFDKEFMYYVNDGVYGSFNCVLYDHTTPLPKVLKCSSSMTRCASSVWGQTCDGLDKINDALLLPELSIGDWLYYEDMGAYTVSAHSSFNGFLRPVAYYYCGSAERKQLERLLTCSKDDASEPCQMLTRNQFKPIIVQEEIDCC